MPFLPFKELGTSSLEEELGISVDTKLKNISQQHALAAKALLLTVSRDALGGVWPAGWGMGSFSSTQHWWGHARSTVPSSGLLSMRDMYAVETPTQGCKVQERTEVSLLWGKTESWDCWAWRRQLREGLISMYKFLKGGCKEDGWDSKKGFSKV